MATRTPLKPFEVLSLLAFVVILVLGILNKVGLIDLEDHTLEEEIEDTREASPVRTPGPLEETIYVEKLYPLRPRI